jgi:Skp family chaperone for outer membrane proteins
MKAPPERLGSFYLGAKYDFVRGTTIDEPINYDARDLTTHAVCLGMTGSGKTGLCVCLLEEAALDKVPAIIIDPKGDITNLLLQFPNLNSKDFEPWVNVDDARRKGMSTTEYAVSVADTWKKGLSDWGINPERIAQLKDSVEYTIFTPGSEAGVPVSIISSLASPHLDFNVDGEAARDRISGVVAALIDLMGLKLDPVRSVEGILLSNIFEYYWSRGEDLTIEKLITSIQRPPFSKLGVFDLDAFYPAKDRFQLAMVMNTLIASPSFASWLRGESLDVDKLLYNANGKPRHSIFYLAHLSDNERMFFVTLLLESVVTWVRQQQGTTSLRAILYFDEVFGFMPPVAEPSAKKPLLTLLKQARAFGLGVTLVTQNPVDIDYKGLTNTGTWFIGKLQAERDKEKVVQGLKGAIMESGGAGEETDYDSLINKLTSRVFILNNIHQGPPVGIQSRWAMSYLRGPLTKPQISELMKDRHVTPSLAQPAAAPANMHADAELTPPSIDPKITQVYISDPIVAEQPKAEFNQTAHPGVTETRLVYEPRLMAKTTIAYYDKRLGVDRQNNEVMLLSPGEESEARWDGAQGIPLDKIRYSSHPEGSASYKPLPNLINTSEKINALGRSLSEYLLLNSRLKILSHKDLNITQRQGEDERTFNIRLRDAARERRDSEVEKIQKDYEDKIGRLEDKIHSLERYLSSDQEEYQARKREEYIGAGETVLGFFIGRRRTTGITTASRRRRMTQKAENEVQETQGKLGDLKKDVDELEAELKDAVDKVTQKWETVSDEVTIVELKPKRGDVRVELLAIAWTPIQ